MAVLAPPPIAAPEERVLLEKVSWGTYESLLADYEDCPAPRMTYDHGRLEMMMTISSSHEDSKETLALVIQLVALEWELDLVARGSTTFRNKELELGAEPDSCYYLHNAERVRRLKKIDLSVDPPPDLVIEVQISRPLLSKLPAWAGFGVPELWTTNGQKVQIMSLADGKYEERAQSDALFPLSASLLEEFFEKNAALPAPAWRKLVREWAREHRPA